MPSKAQTLHDDERVGQQRVRRHASSGVESSPSAATPHATPSIHHSKGPAPALTSRDLLQLQRTVGNRQVARLVARSRQGARAAASQPQSAQTSGAVQREKGDAKKGKKGAAKKPQHGQFDISGATYTLQKGEGCKIVVSFKPGKDIPRGTRLSIIQAFSTTLEQTDRATINARITPGQADDASHARIDQFADNPSPFYLDYISEELLQLLKYAKMSKEELSDHNITDIRDYDECKSRVKTSRKKFDRFWAYYDSGKLAKLATVQKKTGQKGIKQQEGKRAAKPTGLTGFIRDVYAKDRDATMYDEPKHNLGKPRKVGEKSTCRFHTAAVTKQAGGDAVVWDVIEWGYTIEKNKDGNMDWELLPMRHISLAGSMMKGALQVMISNTKNNYAGPDDLKSATG